MGFSNRLAAVKNLRFVPCGSAKEKAMLVANILVKSDFKENRKLGTTKCDLSALLYGTSSTFAVIGQTFEVLEPFQDFLQGNSLTYKSPAAHHCSQL